MRSLARKVKLFASQDSWPFNGVLLVTWVVILLLLFRPQVRCFDPVGYYSWLRSAVIQGHLDVSDEFAHYGCLAEREISATGYRLNHWPVGSALLWLPFFLVGHLFSLIGQVLGLPLSADGYGWPYTLATALGSAIYALIALHWLYGLCREYAQEHEATLAVITAWLASPLVFYMSAHPLMSHSNDFFINTLFFRLWARDTRPTWRSRFLLGFVGGLAACVRLQNAPLLMWPAVEEMAEGIKTAFSAKLELIGRWVALAGGFLLGFFPQMFVWRIVVGQWLVLNPYEIDTAGAFNWTSPHFFDVLFSTNRGLFLWTPMALLGVWGLVWHLRRYRRRWALFLAVNLLLQVYVIGSYSLWSGVAAFGQRYLISTVPAFALGLAALYTAWSHRWDRKAPVVFTAGLVGWNLLLLARYGLRDVPREGPVPLKDLWLGQFTFVINLTQKSSELVQALLRKLP